jgi:hypothetical protein
LLCGKYQQYKTFYLKRKILLKQLKIHPDDLKGFLEIYLTEKIFQSQKYSNQRGILMELEMIREKVKKGGCSTLKECLILFEDVGGTSFQKYSVFR